MDSDRTEFDDVGRPRPSTKAAEIAEKIAELEAADGIQSLIASDERAANEASMAVKRFREERGRELLLEKIPEAEQTHAAFMRWVEEGRAKFGAMTGVASAVATILVQSRLYDPKTVPSFEHHSAAIRALEQQPPLPLPSQLLAELDAEGDRRGE